VLVAPSLRVEALTVSGGLIALLVASPSWAIGSVYARRAPLPPSPFMATACEMIMGGGALLVVSWLQGEPKVLDWASVSARSWGALAFLTVLGSIVAFSAYVWLLSNVPLTLTSTYAYVNPVVAVLLGWWLAAERLEARTLVGGAVIVAAVAMITTASKPSGGASSKGAGASRGTARPA